MILLVIWIVSIARQSLQYRKEFGWLLAAMLALSVIAYQLNSALYEGLVGDYFFSMLAILMAYGHFANQEFTDARNTTH